MQRHMVYALFIYLFVLLFGLNFFITGISLGLLGAELALFFLAVILPAVFLALYWRLPASRGRLLHALILITLAAAVVVVSVFIIPATYG